MRTTVRPRDVTLKRRIQRCLIFFPIISEVLVRGFQVKLDVEGVDHGERRSFDSVRFCVDLSSVNCDPQFRLVETSGVDAHQTSDRDLPAHDRMSFANSVRI